MLLAAFAARLAVGAEPAPRIAPAAAWVSPVALPITEAVTTRADHGYQYLFYDRQIRVTPDAQSTYVRMAVRAVNQGGLGEVAHVEIQYNPAFETLTMHEVNVRRGGQTSARLARSAIKVLERERELEYRVLDGRKSANLFLDDVRVGDVVEYAYTIDGRNPVFRDVHFGHFDLQWSVPVERMHYRLLWPRGRPLKLLARNGAEVVAPVAVGDFEERVWNRSGVEPLTVESDAPGSYNPYASIDWGDLDSWQAVADWAVPLYQTPAALGPELTRAVRAIAQSSVSPQERIAAALRLVQGNVRYLGVEIGVNSHLPQPPDLVYQRRFGDCKDKALLLVAILRHLGIDASPSLVNTDIRRGLEWQLPSPGLFDHAIVHVTLGDKAYWLDPTRATQPGRLQTLYQPDYGDALVVQPGTHALTSMTAGSASRLNKRDIFVALDATGGEGKPATMIVTSVYQGLSADVARDDLTSRSAADMEKSYLNFYAGLYPGAASAGAIDVRDEPDDNRLTVVEHYVLPKFWHKPETGGRVRGTAYAEEMKEFLKGTTQPVRQSPLRVRYPVEVNIRTEVRLPVDWKASASHEKIKSDAFEYEGAVTWPERDRLVMTDTYRSLADEVPAERVVEHNEKLEKVRDHLGYTLYMPSAKAAKGDADTGVDWTGVVLSVVLGAGLCGAWVVLHRRARASKAAEGVAP